MRAHGEDDMDDFLDSLLPCAHRDEKRAASSSAQPAPPANLGMQPPATGNDVTMAKLCSRFERMMKMQEKVLEAQIAALTSNPGKQPTPPDIRDEPATTSSAQVTMQANHDDGADDMQTSDFLPDAVGVEDVELPDALELLDKLLGLANLAAFGADQGLEAGPGPGVHHVVPVLGRVGGEAGEPLDQEDAGVANLP